MVAVPLEPGDRVHLPWEVLFGKENGLHVRVPASRVRALRGSRADMPNARCDAPNTGPRFGSHLGEGVADVREHVARVRLRARLLPLRDVRAATVAREHAPQVRDADPPLDVAD